MASEVRSANEIRAALRDASGERLLALIEQLEDDGRATVRQAVAAAVRRHASLVAEAGRLEGLLAFELKLSAGGLVAVAGVDEVGRGALAGPVTAAAVILDHTVALPVGLDDSKRMKPAARVAVAEVLRSAARASCVEHVTADVIDSIGIAPATRLAMRRALAGLGLEPGAVVVDGIPAGVHEAEHAMPKADASVACVAAASVIAKVERDSLMVRLSEVHPRWGFDVNKGYGTPEHMALLSEHGPSPVHRRSFIPGGGTASLI